MPLRRTRLVRIAAGYKMQLLALKLVGAEKPRKVLPNEMKRGTLPSLFSLTACVRSISTSLALKPIEGPTPGKVTSVPSAVSHSGRQATMRIEQQGYAQIIYPVARK